MVSPDSLGNNLCTVNNDGNDVYRTVMEQKTCWIPAFFQCYLMDDKPTSASKSALPLLLTSHSLAAQLTSGAHSWAPIFQATSALSSICSQ